MCSDKTLKLKPPFIEGKKVKNLFNIYFTSQCFTFALISLYYVELQCCNNLSSIAYYLYHIILS